MLRPCQHQLAFSKRNWYANALKAVIPKKKILLHAFMSQCRATATLTKGLIPSSTDIAIPQRILTPVEPFTQQEINPGDDYRRCSGFKKYTGQQCRRFIRTDGSISSSTPVYCFNHDPKRPVTKRKKYRKRGPKPKKKKLEKNARVQIRASQSVIEDTVDEESLLVPVQERNVFKPPDRIYNCWDLWLGDHIKGEQRNLMQLEMRKPISNSDRPGYIYAYYLDKGPRASKESHAYFKIGRTTDPHRRMYQLANVCNYEPKIIELFPSFPISLDQRRMTTNLQTVDQTLDGLPKCPISHRIERLIHLELSCLYERAEFKCPVCGSVHREWIKVDRTSHSDGTLMNNQDLWFANIRPVILRWLQYGVLASSIKSNRFIK